MEQSCGAVGVAIRKLLRLACGVFELIGLLFFLFRGGNDILSCMKVARYGVRVYIFLNVKKNI